MLKNRIIYMFDLKELFKMGGTISKKSEIVVGGIGLIFLLIVWYLVTKNGLIPTKILPNPVDVVKSYGALITELDLFKNVWYSISLNLLGYFYALLVAIPLGFVIGLYPVTNALFSKYFDALRFLPLPAASGIFIAMFGLGFTMKADFLAFGILIYILPVVVQRISELQNPANDKDNVYLQTIKTLGASNWQKFRYVYFPYVMEKISDDIRVLTAISWTYIVIVEQLNKEGGVGAMISTLNRQSRTPEVYALLLLIIAIGVLQDLSLKGMDKLMFPSKHNKTPINLKKWFVK